VALLGILGEVKRGGKGKGGGALAHDRELCTLCGGCAPRCPADALAVYETYLEIDLARCTACGACAPGCPTGALRMDTEDLRSSGGARNGLCPPSSRNDSKERGPP
jgi:ferredoxin